MLKINTQVACKICLEAYATLVEVTITKVTQWEEDEVLVPHKLSGRI